MAHQMQRFVFVRIIGFLENSDIIRTAFMKVLIFIHIDRINLKTYISEILAGQFTGLTDVFHITHMSALACQHQDFLNTGICNDFHFMLDFLHVQFLAVNMVITVKTTVNAIIFTVIGNIKRCEKIHTVAEMVTALHSSFFCHLFQKWLCRR